jgi:hypothetical protein
MSSFIVAAGGRAEFTVPASSRVAIYSDGNCVLGRETGFPNYTTKESLIAFVPRGAEFLSATFTTATTVVIDNSGNPFPAFYEVGTAPAVKAVGLKAAPIQGAPVALDVTGDIPVASVLGGVLTSAAAAVTGTLPTGAVLEAASAFAVNDSVDWSIIKVGANNFTIQVAANHTFVGNLTVTTATSARLRTRKISAGVYETYRLS